MTRFVMKRSQAAALVLALISLTGCGSLVPPSDAPQVPLRENFRADAVATETPLADGVTTTPIATADEWDGFFIDDRLRRVVGLALVGNRSLRASVAAVERVRAQYGISQSNRWPDLRGSTSANLQASDGGNTSRTYTVSLGVAAWEVDLYNRVGSLEGAALARFLAQQEIQRSARLSLVAQVADAWLTLAAEGQRQRLADELRTSQQQTLDLTDRQYRLGAASGLQRARAQTAFEAARGEAARSAAAVRQARLALELLAGQPLMDALLPDQQSDKTTALPDVPAALPATVLLQRPDLRAAEQQLQAAAFDVGTARAARFPRLTLTANAGLRSTGLDKLLSGSGFLSLVPTLDIPLLDAGGRQAQVDVTEASRREVMANYEAALQTAFREVADALAVRDSLAERLAAQQAQVAAAERSQNLVEQTYRLGASSQLELLDAQRQLAAARQGLVTLRQIEQANRVVLLRALGGRWTL